MALRNILTQESATLRKTSKPVTVFNESLWTLLDDMKETMHKYDGCGIAAPQVGVLKRVIIVEVNNIYIEMVDPEIIAQKGEQCNVEGCLSVKGVAGYVNRPKTVTVKGFDRFGNEYKVTGTDYFASALCHEIDHLDGILFIDKMVKPYEQKK